MRVVEDFLPKILPMVPGCSNPVAVNGIQQAIKEFCIRTSTWRHTAHIESSETISDLLCQPEGATVIRIEAVRFNGRSLKPISVVELNERIADWRSLAGDTPPGFYTQLEFDTIRLVPLAAGQVEIDMILRPKDESKDVPDYILDHFRNTIADGAMSYIYMVPGQSFSDAERGVFYQNKFNRELDRLSTQGIQGQQRARLRVRPNYF